MKKIKYITIIFTFSYLLNACSFYSKNHVDNTQNIKPEETNIENLPNGNYRYCSEPASEPNINGFDGEAWCFEFKKKGYDIVGTYSYQAPKDTRQICIEGKAEGNKIIGIGYEEIQYGETKPDIEKERLVIAQGKKTHFPKKGFWDNYDIVPDGFNLKVSSPEFHRLLEPEHTNNTYWAWIRFNKIELNLNKFHRRELRKYFYQGEIIEVSPINSCL